MTADPIPFPASPYCRVRARVASIWADGPDDGTHPDWRPAAGEKVTLTPSIGSQLLTYDVAGPEPIIVTVERVECVVDEDGWLAKADGRPVFIAPTDDPLMSATGWTWTASIKGKSIAFSAPSGGVVDLALFVATPAVDAVEYVSVVQVVADYIAANPPDVEQAVADYLTANPPAAAPDATTATKGILQLAGDLGGTADAPTVPGLAGKADAGHGHTAVDIDSGAATDGHVLTADGVGGVAWEAPPAGGGGAVGVTADDTPSAPAEGESASYLVTSAVTWPAGLVWSTDPDGGVAPTITGTALVSMFTLGGVTRAIMGATFSASPPPVEDLTPPTAGALLASEITAVSFRLTVAGAGDEGGLHAAPFAFSTDAGGTYSPWQSAADYFPSGLTSGTGYTCRHKVRDAALNEATGAAITVTTASASTVPVWTATLTLGAASSTSQTVTASALATDDIAVTGYEVSYDGGGDWAPITPDGLNFILTGAASTTYSTTHLRAKDGDGNFSNPLPVPEYTLPAWAGVNATYVTRAGGSSIADVPIGPASADRTVIAVVTYLSNESFSPTGCTIGGVSATADVAFAPSETNGAPGGFVFRAAVPSGTTATVTVDGARPLSTSIAVWTVDSPLTLIDSQVTEVGNTVSATIDTVSDGVVFAGACGNLGTGDGPWSNAVERYQVSSHAGADALGTGAPKTITWAGYSNRLMAASYGPA